MANAENYRVGRRAENGKMEGSDKQRYGKQLHGYHSRGRVTYYYTVRAINDKVVSASYDTKKSITCVRKLGKAELQEFKNTSSGER